MKKGARAKVWLLDDYRIELRSYTVSLNFKLIELSKKVLSDNGQL